MEGLKKSYELLCIIFRTGQISMNFYWCESLGYQGEKENNLSKPLHKKRQKGTFGGDGCIWSWWWWWFPGYILILKLNKLDTLHMYSFLYVNHTSIKLFLKRNKEWKALKNKSQPDHVCGVSSNSSLLTALAFPNAKSSLCQTIWSLISHLI